MVVSAADGPKIERPAPFMRDQLLSAFCCWTRPAEGRTQTTYSGTVTEEAQLSAVIGGASLIPSLPASSWGRMCFREPESRPTAFSPMGPAAEG